MNTKTIIILSSILLTVSACAKRPASIVPISISEDIYAPFACQELAIKKKKEQAKLDALSSEQGKAVATDALGVFFVGIPIGSLADFDKEGEIAVSKGRLVSIENAQTRKSCV